MQIQCKNLSIPLQKHRDLISLFNSILEYNIIREFDFSIIEDLIYSLIFLRHNSSRGKTVNISEVEYLVYNIDQDQESDLSHQAFLTTGHQKEDIIKYGLCDHCVSYICSNTILNTEQPTQNLDLIIQFINNLGAEYDHFGRLKEEVSSILTRTFPHKVINLDTINEVINRKQS